MIVLGILLAIIFGFFIGSCLSLSFSRKIYWIFIAPPFFSLIYASLVFWGLPLRSLLYPNNLAGIVKGMYFFVFLLWGNLIFFFIMKKFPLMAKLMAKKIFGRHFDAMR